MKLKQQIPCSLGIVIALQGINIAALLKVVLGQNMRILTPLTMFLTFLLLVDYGRIQDLRFSRYNEAMGTMALYLTYVTILAFFSEYSLSTPTYGFYYQLAYLITILALWNNDDRLDMAISFRSIYWVSGFLCAFALVLILINYRVTGSAFFQGLGRDSSGQIIITRATTASIAYILLAAALAKESRTVPDRVCRIVFLVIAVMVMFLSRRRTVYISGILMVIMYISRSRKSKGRSLGKTGILRSIALFFVLALVFLLLSANPTTAEILDRGFHSLQKGVSTFFGRSSDDIAAGYRYERIRRVPYEYLVNTSFFHFLFGNGYMTEWLDLPLIQAFNDLGLFGGTAFLLAYLVMPLRCLLYRSKAPLVIFAQYCSIAQITSLVGSGIPYGSLFFPMALLVYVVKLDMRDSTSPCATGDASI